MKLINKIYGRISVLVKCKRQSHRGNFSGKNFFSHEICHAAERGNLHYDCIVVVTCYSASANPVVWVYFNDRKMVKRAQQTITCRCSLARTKSSTATTTTSAICMETSTCEWIVV